MSTNITHYPHHPEDIRTRTFIANGVLYTRVDFDDTLAVIAVSDSDIRMHPQVFTARLRELCDTIDTECDRLRDIQAHTADLPTVDAT